MNLSFISRVGSPRLVILFAGWAMDEKPFEDLALPGYDIAVVWDYSDERLSSEFWRDYREICILAWSYGVYFAGRFIQNHKDLPVTARVAVNGTLYPVDGSKGIPKQLFEATLSSLSEPSVMKFYRRMCGNAQIFNEFHKRLPRRSLESLTKELDAIGKTYTEYGVPSSDWDYAFISEADRIYPAQAQREAWRDKCGIFELDCGHLPDFQYILERAFILKDGVSDAFTRSLETYNSNAVAQRSVALKLASLIENKAPLSGEIIEIGCGSGFLTKELEKMLDSDARLSLVDVSPIDPSLEGRHIQDDAEIFLMNLPDDSVTAIVSASAVQWFNSPGNFLRNAFRILKPGGFLAVAVYGDLTFNEIPGHNSPSRTFSKKYLETIIPEGFSIDVNEEAEYVQHFSSPVDLLRHFRLTGVTPINKSAKSAVLARKIIQSNISKLTYNPLFLLLTKKKCCNFVT